MIDENKRYDDIDLKKIQKPAREISDYLDTSIIVLIVFLFIAIVALFFVDFSFNAEIDWRGVGVDSGLLVACTVGIYTLLREYMQRKGRKTGDWLGSKDRLEKLGKSIIADNYARHTVKYCRSWEDERFDNDREEYLARVNLKLSDYKSKYCTHTKRELQQQFPDLSKVQIKYIIRTNRIKPLKYDERYLFVNSAKRGIVRTSPSGRISTSTLNTLSILKTTMTTIIVSLFSITFLGEVIFNFSVEAVIKCLIKIAVTLFFGGFGMISGFNFTSRREVQEMDAKSDELENFIKWCETNKLNN